MIVLNVQDLSKTYLQGDTTVEVLSKVTFELKTGETLSIVGPSGSGKTTLLSLLAGLEAATSGSVFIKGENIFSLSEMALSLFRSNHIGIIFQQFHLMPHLTALENISLPLEIQGDSQAQQKALEALEAVQLSHRKNHLPRELSGGECQRIAIARAIVVKPDLLLADEPSGNLDADTGKRIMDLIFNLVHQNKMTLILVTHNQELAKRCHRQIILQGGTVQ